MFMTMSFDVLLATGETVYMVLVSTLFACCFGLPLGTVLFMSSEVKPRPYLKKCLSAVINISRSVPFIILLVAIIPLTRLIVGSSIGINAAIVPLTIGAIPFFARLVDNTFQTLPKGLLEAGFAMGASHWQMISQILIPEARPALIQSVTLMAVTLVNYSAMAGTVGGGGLGDLAIRYGYQRFNWSVMLVTVAILVVLVQLIQWVGDRLVRYYTR